VTDSIATLIPDSFVYRTVNHALTMELKRRGLNGDRKPSKSEVQEILEATSNCPRGLMPLGYQQRSHVGPGVHVWVWPENTTRVVIRMDGRYRGRLTVAVSSSGSEARATQFSPSTGMPVGRFSWCRDGLPGIPVWSQAFTTKSSFLDALRQAHSYVVSGTAEAMAALIGLN
jgi:hypothetical protein